MPLFSPLPFTGEPNDDLFGSLAESQNALIQARKDASARDEQSSSEAKGGFSHGTSGALGALGGLASVIPGGQVIGAGLGVLGSIIKLFS